MDWLDLLAVQGTLKSLLQHHSSKASILRHSAFFIGQLSHPYMTTGKTIALTRRTFVACLKACNSLFSPSTLHTNESAPVSTYTHTHMHCTHHLQHYILSRFWALFPILRSHSILNSHFPHLDHNCWFKLFFILTSRRQGQCVICCCIIFGTNYMLAPRPSTVFGTRQKLICWVINNSFVIVSIEIHQYIAS